MKRHGKHASNAVIDAALNAAGGNVSQAIRQMHADGYAASEKRTSERRSALGMPAVRGKPAKHRNGVAAMAALDEKGAIVRHRMREAAREVSDPLQPIAEAIKAAMEALGLERIEAEWNPSEAGRLVMSATPRKRLVEV